MSEENKQVINIHLHGSDGERVGDEIVRFKLHDTIMLVGKLCFISLTEFQCLNSIFNITSSNNTILGQTIEEGFYHTRELLKNLQLLLPAGMDVYFNENTLRFVFQTLSVPFTLTGTILQYLGIDDGASVLEDGFYRVTSKKPFDLYKRSHSVYIITNNLRTSSNMSADVNSKYISEKLGKVDIQNEFGQYIVYYSNGASNRSLVYDNTISTLEIMLVNDYNEPVLMENDFSLSLKLEVYDLDNNGWIEQTEMTKKYMFLPHQYPVIQEQDDFIQMKIDELNEIKNKNKNKK